ncbi:SWI/SNF complex subunit SMARCC2 isoform X2 [Neocloeon triangulifer]|uniref:SWI/SNF complex subunit SMARCC2 isoform X2 n=1 Tax=Neocloeon triangulifer TaxID=2078957 RepID=UPI00286F59E8|nr:SWI/SNF complex subunit SMARCC2 isoform X2 [Neocloeon triangulifer]
MMGFAPKKDGGPNTKFFESPETLTQLDAVRTWLLKNCKKHVQTEPPSNKSLSSLTIQLIQFQEDNLGKNATKPPMTRLPARCFLDFKPGGALCHILATAFKFRTDQGWRRFDFQSPSRLERNIELFVSMEKALIQNKCLTLPVVCLRPDLDKATQAKVREIVKKHQGTVTENEDQATHIIYPSCDPLDEEYARPLFHRDRMVLLHWYYFPDSYDSWVAAELPIEPPDSPQSRNGPWRVNASWVNEVEEYNEWMTEEDYEVDESGKKKVHKLRLSVEDMMNLGDPERSKKKPKRKRSPSPPPKPGKRKSGRAPGVGGKKHRGEDEDDDASKDAEESSQDHSIIQEVNLKPGSASNSNSNPSNASRSKDSEMQPIKGGVVLDLDEDAEKGEDSQTGRGVENQDAAKDDGQEDNVTEQTHHIVIPSYAAWFDYNAIHTVERRAMPEFFNGKNRSKTPEIYLAYRNFMVDTYRLNPTEYLTSTACRRNLAGDVCAIMRVHAFLEQWGLVNYQVDAECRPTPMGPPPTSHFHVLADTPSGLAPVNPPKTPQPSAAKTLLDLDKKDPKIKTEGEEAIGANFGLKLDQYTKKPAAMRNKTAANMAREWTEQETLLLLEGLELYKDDWNKVCEHVGSRTQDECILHFLRLPIEDPYLESVEDNGWLGPLAFQPIPFSQAGNPIMSTVAFLASVVDPRIASSAAKAAMQEFSNIRDEVPSALLDAHLQRVAASGKEGAFDPSAGLLQSGIAGTAAPGDEKVEGDEKKEEEKEGEEKDKIEDKESIEKKEDEKKDESMEVDKEEKPKEDEEEPKESEDMDAESKEAEEEIKEKDPAVVAKERIIKDAQLQSAAAAALAAAAVKAKHLAAVEERKIKSLVALLVETQMKKLEIKLRHFEELETTMEREREGLEYQRQQLIAERQQFHLEQLKAAEFRARQQAHQRAAAEQHLWAQQQAQPPPAGPTATAQAAQDTPGSPQAVAVVPGAPMPPASLPPPVIQATHSPAGGLPPSSAQVAPLPSVGAIVPGGSPPQAQAQSVAVVSPADA